MGEEVANALLALLLPPRCRYLAAPLSAPECCCSQQGDFRWPAARVGWGQTTRGATSSVIPSQAVLMCLSFVLKMTSNISKFSNNLSTSSILKFKLWHLLLLSNIFKILLYAEDTARVKFLRVWRYSVYFSHTVFWGSGHCNIASVTNESVMNNLLLS